MCPDAITASDRRGEARVPAPGPFCRDGDRRRAPHAAKRILWHYERGIERLTAGLAAQRRVLMLEHWELGFLGRFAPGKQHRTAEETAW